MKFYVCLAIFALMSSMAVVQANDLAFYSGPTNPGWISDGAVAENVKTIRNDAGVKALFNNIEDFGDGDEEGDGSPLAQWCVEHTGNGQPRRYHPRVRHNTERVVSVPEQKARRL